MIHAYLVSLQKFPQSFLFLSGVVVPTAWDQARAGPRAGPFFHKRVETKRRFFLKLPRLSYISPRVEKPGEVMGRIPV